jgi:mono/diheme cytochrome c family protein
MIRALCAAIVFILAAGDSAGARPLSDESRDRSGDWVAPASASSKVNPLATRGPETFAGGQKIFRQRCAACHGEEGRGSPKAPDLTQPVVQAQSDGALFWKISSGNTRRGMPSFSFLPEPQRWQLALFVRSMP